MNEGACDVSLGDYDGDPAEVFNSHELKARQPHKCFECGETIAVGERYERVSGKWEGKWSTYRFCLPCSEIGLEFSDGCRLFGNLWEGMGENWDEGANLQACVGSLIFPILRPRPRPHELLSKKAGRDRSQSKSSK